MAAAASAETEFEIRGGLPALALRLCIGFGVLAALSLAIVVAGKLYGRTLVNAGHTTATTEFEVVIANDVITVPANMIRRAEQRHSGVANRLDLYVHWPSLSGFSEKLAPAFNDVDPETNSIVFVSMMPRATTFDMAGRFDAVYANVITGDADRTASGLIRQPLSADHGYIDEALFYSEPASAAERRFAARCQNDDGAAGLVLAACTTEIHVGETLTAQVRFPAKLLQDWRRLAAALPVFIDEMLTADGR